jgi:hypothetical protein
MYAVTLWQVRVTTDDVEIQYELPFSLSSYIRHHKRQQKRYEFILRAFDYIVTDSFGYILHCVCLNLYCGGFILFCNVCVCVCVYIYIYTHCEICNV